MNKTIQWVLNVVFLIAILYLAFRGNKMEEVEIEKEVVESSVIDTLQNSALTIKYVNTDTLWSKYNLVSEMRKNLESRKSEYERDLEQSIKSFEKEVMEFQEAAPTMSRFEGEQKQKSLLQKEQELGRKQEELSMKLMEMVDQMKRDIRSKILKALKKYESQDVDMIFDYSSSSSLLMVGDSLDITEEVLEQLNQVAEDNKQK